MTHSACILRTVPSTPSSNTKKEGKIICGLRHDAEITALFDLVGVILRAEAEGPDLLQ